MQQYSLTISKVTGLLIFAERSSKTYTGSKEDLIDIYKKVQMHNFLFGWWGIIGFVWNIMAIRRNIKAKQQLESL